MMTTRTFNLTVHYEDGHYWTEVEEIPGCFASGRDLDELKEALAEAIGMCLEAKQVSVLEVEPADPVQHLRARAELLPA